MDSLNLTIFFAILQIAACIIAFLLRPYPIITIFHLSLLVSFISFGIRPLLSALSGGFTLYPTPMGWSAYNVGLLYHSLFFTLPYIAGYCFFSRKFRKKTTSFPVRINLSLFSMFLVFGVGAFAVIIMHLLSKGAWLPSARSQTITSVVPFGKILFPLAVIPLSISIPVSFVLLMRYIRQNISLTFAILVLLLCAFLLLTFLYQRGFLLNGILWSLFLYGRISGKLTYKKAFALCLIALFLLFFLRPFAVFLSSGGRMLGTTFERNLVQGFISSPNFDGPDVWQVFVFYVAQNGYLDGRSLLALPARFLTPAMRRAVGLRTAVDIINEFYWGEQYWRTNFGFAISSTQEIYLNFGPTLIPFFALLSGFWVGFWDVWLYRFRKITLFNVFLVAIVFVLGSLGGELAGMIQWALAYLVLGSVLSLPEETALQVNAVVTSKRNLLTMKRSFS